MSFDVPRVRRVCRLAAFHSRESMVRSDSSSSLGASLPSIQPCIRSASYEESAQKPIIDGELRASAPTRPVLNVIVHMFIALIICSVDRVVLSVTMIVMAKEHGWSKEQQSVIFSALFFGYTLTGVPSGRAADNYGGRRVMALAVSVWSAMTVLTPYTARLGMKPLLATRFVLGCAEGAAMPSMNAIVHQWCPKDYLSRALGFIYSAMYFGSVVGLLLCPVILATWGVSGVFSTCGIFGIAWVGLFLVMVPEQARGDALRDDSGDAFRNDSYDAQKSGGYTLVQSHPYSPSADLSEASFSSAPAVGSSSSDIASDIRFSFRDDVVRTEDEEVPMSRLLGERAVYAIFCAHFASTWGYFLLVTYLPIYLVSRFGVDIKQSAFLSTLPWFVMFFCANISGSIADAFLKFSIPKTRVRKIMQSIGLLGPACFFLLLMTASNEYIAVLYVTLGLGFSSFSQAGGTVFV